jgi:hypothetical protein
MPFQSSQWRLLEYTKLEYYKTLLTVDHRRDISEQRDRDRVYLAVPTGCSQSMTTPPESFQANVRYTKRTLTAETWQ